MSRLADLAVVVAFLGALVMLYAHRAALIDVFMPRVWP